MSKLYHVVKTDEVITFDSQKVQLFQHERKLFAYTGDEHIYEFNNARVRYPDKTTITAANSDKRQFKLLLWTSDLTVLLNKPIVALNIEHACAIAQSEFDKALAADHIYWDYTLGDPDDMTYVGPNKVTIANGRFTEVL